MAHTFCRGAVRSLREQDHYSVYHFPQTLPLRLSCAASLASRNLMSLQMKAQTSGNGSERAPEAETSSYIRPHLQRLAPYTPIEPFEVLSQRLDLH